MPPFATAFTTFLDVQLLAVPLPMTRSGVDVSTARASAGMGASPAGLPAALTGAAETKSAATRRRAGRSDRV